MLHVITETEHDGAEILLSQGIRPGFKRKFPVREFAPGRGLDRDNLYVAFPNTFSKGSFGNIRLHLNIQKSQLQVSPEQKQLGVQNVLESLRTVDGAVTKGRISKRVFTLVEVWKGGSRWDQQSPSDFLAHPVPELPSVKEFQRAVRNRAEEFSLTPEKVSDLVTTYRRAKLKDKLFLAKDVGLLYESSGFEFFVDLILLDNIKG